MKLTSVVLTLVCALAPTVLAQSNADVDFEKLGRAFIDARCGKGAEPSACDLATVLERGYASVPIGAFQLHYPAHFLGEKKRPEDLKEITLGLLDLQDVWIAWLAGTDGAAARSDVALLHAFVEGWEPKSLAQLAGQPETLDVFTHMGAGEDVRAAEKRLAQFLHDSEAIGLVMRNPGPTQLVLSPTRLDFMQWVGWAGLTEPAKQAELWFTGIDQWTQFWSGWTIVLALEYAPWNGFDPTFRAGKDMRSFEPTGMVEQVALQAGMGLLSACVDRPLDHPDHAIAMNLVIEFVGQINTVSGEGQLGMSGGSTQPYSRFVPGGDPDGGELPKRSAEGRNALIKNQWREGNGKDHFLKALRKGQKNGYKIGAKQKTTRWKDKSAHFLLRSTSGKWVVSAPFFGPHAAEQKYPPFEFINDYAQFYRAYKSCFWHWLRTRGDPEGEEASQARFRKALRRFADVKEDPREFDAILEEAYGVPLSAADDETDSLEWRFLAYLKKGK